VRTAIAIVSGALFVTVTAGYAYDCEQVDRLELMQLCGPSAPCDDDTHPETFPDTDAVVVCAGQGVTP
jgi:hypothetical protein